MNNFRAVRGIIIAFCSCSMFQVYQYFSAQVKSSKMMPPLKKRNSRSFHCILCVAYIYIYIYIYIWRLSRCPVLWYILRNVSMRDLFYFNHFFAFSRLCLLLYLVVAVVVILLYLLLLFVARLNSMRRWLSWFQNNRPKQSSAQLLSKYLPRCVIIMIYYYISIDIIVVVIVIKTIIILYIFRFLPYYIKSVSGIRKAAI